MCSTFYLHHFPWQPAIPNSSWQNLCRTKWQDLHIENQAVRVCTTQPDCRDPAACSFGAHCTLLSWGMHRVLRQHLDQKSLYQSSLPISWYQLVYGKLFRERERRERERGGRERGIRAMFVKMRRSLSTMCFFWAGTSWLKWWWYFLSCNYSNRHQSELAMLLVAIVPGVWIGGVVEVLLVYKAITTPNNSSRRHEITTAGEKTNKTTTWKHGLVMYAVEYSQWEWCLSIGLLCRLFCGLLRLWTAWFGSGTSSALIAALSILFGILKCLGGK